MFNNAMTQTEVIDLTPFTAKGKKGKFKSGNQFTQASLVQSSAPLTAK